MADNTQVQTQLTALRTLQQSYDALATASASGATATALENAKQAILTAIGAIDNQVGDIEEVLEYIEQGGMPTITAIAKQGTNASATLTATQDYASAAASASADASSKAGDLKSWIGVPTSGRTVSSDAQTAATQAANAYASAEAAKTLIGQPATGQPSDLFAAIAAGGGGDAQESTSQSILASLNALIQSHIVNGVSFDGWVFQNGYSPATFGDAVAHIGDLTSIYDESITEIVGFQGFLNSALNMTSLSLPNLTRIEAEHFCDLQNGLSSLVSVNLPRLYTIRVGSVGIFGTTAASALKSITLPALASMYNNTFRQCKSVREVHLPECTEMNSGGMNFWVESNIEIIDIPKMSSNYVTNNFNSSKIIDIIIGQNFTSNANMSSWSPSEALSTTSSSLVYEGETFANNREKLLYNIRNHMAANLPDRTGLSALTITFSSAVKAAINADTATAQAFSNKNWTIA